MQSDREAATKLSGKDRKDHKVIMAGALVAHICKYLSKNGFEHTVIIAASLADTKLLKQLSSAAQL